MVPLTDKDTDFKRQLVELTLERAHQGGPLPPACRGQLYTLIPLMPERLGLLRELLVIERTIGLDRTNHMPVPTATEFEQAMGSIPTVKEHIDVEPRGQQPLECPQHVLGQHRLLAKTQPLLGGALLVQTPHGLLPQGEAPILGIGACPEFSADFDMHRPIGVAGFFLPLTLGVIVMIGHGFEMSRAFVFFAQRVIQTHIEGPLIGLLGVGHQVGHDQVAHRCP